MLSCDSRLLPAGYWSLELHSYFHTSKSGRIEVWGLQYELPEFNHKLSNSPRIFRTTLVPISGLYSIWSRLRTMLVPHSILLVIRQKQQKTTHKTRTGKVQATSNLICFCSLKINHFNQPVQLWNSLLPLVRFFNFYSLTSTKKATEKKFSISIKCGHQRNQISDGGKDRECRTRNWKKTPSENIQKEVNRSLPRRIGNTITIHHHRFPLQVTEVWWGKVEKALEKMQSQPNVGTI